MNQKTLINKGWSQKKLNKRVIAVSKLVFIHRCTEKGSPFLMENLETKEL